MRIVLIPTKLDSIAGDILRQHDFEVIQDAKTPLAELVAKHPDAGAMIVRSEKVTPEIIDALPRLKLIVRAGAGYDTIDSRHARRKGVDVMNTPGANANGVAEEVVAMILAAYRQVVPADQTTRQGLWEKKGLMGRELAGKTVGIVGLGNIGQLLARRLSGFEPTLLGYDPCISASRADELGVRLCPLEEVFRQSDIVSLHVPETPETKAMVNKDLLALMKPGAMLVNCARAGIVVEADLRAAKAEKGLLFCNDVYPKDEPGPKSVADIADVMLPHLGANTHEANYTAAKRAAEQLVAYVQRGISRYVVNRAVPEGLDEGYQLLAYYLTRVARAYLGEADSPSRIETSFYGGLDEHQDWFLAPVVLGLSREFDPFFSTEEAREFLARKGIAYAVRQVDPRKPYGKSITIDLMQGSGAAFTRVSVRGTLTEGRPMVSRLNNVDRLYFDPVGHNLLAEYHDQPGMLAKITAVLARHGINIDDLRAPQDRDSGIALAVLKVNQPLNPEIVHEIERQSNAYKVITLSLE